MANEKQRKTFLSYSRLNKDFAIKLAKELKSEGFDVWLDTLDIPLGSRWDREVERALKESEIFMIILTPNSVDSENVLDEIGYAIDTHKRILPILLEDCEMPLRLRRLQYVDFTKKSFDEGVDSAKTLLRGLIDQPTIPRGKVVAEQKAEEEQAAKVEADRKAKEEAGRLAKQKADEERLAKQKTDDERIAKANVDKERKAKEEAIRLAKAEADHKAQEETERLAKAEADRKAKEDADQLAKQKAEEERLALAETARKVREEAEANRKPKEETDRLAKVEADRRAKEESDHLAAPNAEEGSVPKVASAPQKKRGVSGLVISGIVVAVLSVAGIGIGYMVFSNGGTSATEAPGVINRTTETPAVAANVAPIDMTSTDFEEAPTVTKAAPTNTKKAPTATHIIPTSTLGPISIKDNFSSKSDIWGTCDYCEWKDGTLFFGPYPPTSSGVDQIFYVICEACGLNTYYRVSADVTFVDGYGDRTFGILAGLTDNKDFIAAGTVDTFKDALYESFDYTTNRWISGTFNAFQAVKPGRGTNRIEVEIRPGTSPDRADIYVNVNGSSVIKMLGQQVTPTWAGLYLGWHTVGASYDNFEYEEIPSD